MSDRRRGNRRLDHLVCCAAGVISSWWAGPRLGDIEAGAVTYWGLRLSIVSGGLLCLTGPSFAFGLGDAGEKVVADLNKPVTLGGVGPEHRAAHPHRPLNQVRRSRSSEGRRRRRSLLRERQPSLDFASLDAVSRTLAGLFWARIEALAPDIDSLRLPPAVPALGKRLKTRRRTTNGPDGTRHASRSPCRARSATTRSKRPRTASTAWPAWTNGHGSGRPSSSF